MTSFHSKDGSETAPETSKLIVLGLVPHTRCLGKYTTSSHAADLVDTRCAISKILLTAAGMGSFGCHSDSFGSFTLLQRQLLVLRAIVSKDECSFV